MLTPITIVIYKTTEEGCPVRSIQGQASIAMRKVPKIAESEWKVMKIPWSRREPQAAYDIIQQLSAREDWHARTVKTHGGHGVRPAGSHPAVGRTRGGPGHHASATSGASRDRLPPFGACSAR